MTLRSICQLLKTTKSAEEINSRRDEIAEVIPKVRIMFDYDQKNNAHQYDLWMHSVYVTLDMPRDMEDDMLYLAALLHDIGKPACQCKGKREDDPDMHYYGHPEKSYEIVRDEVIPDLKAKGETLTDEEIERLLYFVRYHDDRIELDMDSLKKHVDLAGFDLFRQLMILQISDARIHVQKPKIVDRIRICTAFAGDEGLEMYKRLKEESL